MNRKRESTEKLMNAVGLLIVDDSFVCFIFFLTLLFLLLSIKFLLLSFFYHFENYFHANGMQMIHQLINLIVYLLNCYFPSTCLMKNMVVYFNVFVMDRWIVTIFLFFFIEPFKPPIMSSSPPQNSSH